MAEKITKKEIILNAALDLFSQKGYHAVGVDEIGQAAGLKGPAIYHYFKSKEDILNQLIINTEVIYQRNIKSAEVPENLDEFVKASMGRINYTLKDPFIQKVRRLITIEQFRSETFSKLATKHFIDDILDINKAAIINLMDKGSIKKGDPQILAMAFNAPITLLIALADREPDKVPYVLEQSRLHIEHFKNTYSQKSISSKGGK